MNSDLEKRFRQVEDRVEIDDTNIEAELIRHPHDFWHVASGVADSVSIRDMAKFRVETYEAELNTTLRREFAEQGVKVTEAHLDRLVTRDLERTKLFEHYLHTKHEADLWLGLKESFSQKGYMLKEVANNQRSDNVAESSYSRQRRDAMDNYRRRD